MVRLIIWKCKKAGSVTPYTSDPNTGSTSECLDSVRNVTIVVCMPRFLPFVIFTWSPCTLYASYMPLIISCGPCTLGMRHSSKARMRQEGSLCSAIKEDQFFASKWQLTYLPFAMYVPLLNGTLTYVPLSFASLFCTSTPVRARPNRHALSACKHLGDPKVSVSN